MTFKLWTSNLIGCRINRGQSACAMQSCDCLQIACKISLHPINFHDWTTNCLYKFIWNTNTFLTSKKWHLIKPCFLFCIFKCQVCVCVYTGLTYIMRTQSPYIVVCIQDPGQAPILRGNASVLVVQNAKHTTFLALLLKVFACIRQKEKGVNIKHMQDSSQSRLNILKWFQTVSFNYPGLINIRRLETDKCLQILVSLCAEPSCMAWNIAFVCVQMHLR